MSEIKPGLIYEKMVAIMAEIGPIAKSRRNEMQKFNYRGIEETVNAAAPVFQKHQVFMTFEMVGAPVVTTEDAGSGKTRTRVILHVRGKFMTTDGSYVTSEAVGEAFDHGDKSSSKAMSVAQRYLILQILMVPTAMVDPEDPRFEGDYERRGNQESQQAPARGRSRPSEGGDSEHVIRAKLEALGAVTPADQDLCVKFLVLQKDATFQTANHAVLTRKLPGYGPDIVQRAKAWMGQS